jgi:HAD superfamily hydrolase (TIGR01509 family)
MTSPVIFDMDGVLVDSEPLYLAAFERYVVDAGSPHLVEWAPNTLGRRQLDFVEDLAPLLGRPVADALDGLERTMQLVLESAVLEPMPGAAEAVARMRAGGRAVGLASGSARWFIDRVVDALGFAGAFAASAAGDEARNGKPDPELYLTVAERLGVGAGTCVAIEDTPVGVAAAKAAGMVAIAVPNRFTAGLDFSAADEVAGTLDEAIALILALDGAAAAQ